MSMSITIHYTRADRWSSFAQRNVPLTIGCSSFMAFSRPVISFPRFNVHGLHQSGVLRMTSSPAGAMADDVRGCAPVTCRSEQERDIVRIIVDT